MTGTQWTQRLSARNSPQDLLDIRAAARDLGHEAHEIPGRTGLVFQNVSQYVILASVAATASLAIYHLWKELSRCRDKAHRDHTSATDAPENNKPPRHQSHTSSHQGRD
jgi:hypothetical protein